MWQIKTFKFKTLADMDAARAKMDAWLKAREGRIEFVQVFIHNGFAVEWRFRKML